MRKPIALLAWCGIYGAMSAGLTNCWLDSSEPSPACKAGVRFCDGNKVVRCVVEAPHYTSHVDAPTSFTEEPASYVEVIVDDCGATGVSCLEDLVQGARVVHCAYRL
jgi:hypothetical protein